MHRVFIVFVSTHRSLPDWVRAPAPKGVPTEPGHFPRTRPAPERHDGQRQREETRGDSVARLSATPRDSLRRGRALPGAPRGVPRHHHLVGALAAFRHRGSASRSATRRLNVGAPTWDASGALVDGGGDLTLGGMSSYYYDIIYIGVFCLCRGAVSDWIWPVLSDPRVRGAAVGGPDPARVPRPPRTRRRRTRMNETKEQKKKRERERRAENRRRR